MFVRKIGNWDRGIIVAMVPEKSVRIWIKKRVGYLLIFVLFLFSACQNAPITETPLNTAAIQLTPYYTQTRSQTELPSFQVDRTPTPRPTPTPTPFTYKVVKGDTMLGIAMRFGVPLEDLMAANQDINPRVLPIGTALIIPLNREGHEFIPSPTPIPMNVGEPVCYQSAYGAVWCFLLVENSSRLPVENVSARISLEGPDGSLLAETEAITLLSVLPEHRSMPVVGYFPPPLPTEFIPHADLIGVLPLTIEDNRYLKASIELEQAQVSPNSLYASVSGFVLLADDQEPATLVWLAVIAYDEKGTVVGVRKWEAYYSDTQNLPTQAVILDKPLQAREKLPFEITVYSLGPQIEDIDILIEARP